MRRSAGLLSTFLISTISTPVRIAGGRPTAQCSCASGRPNMLRSPAFRIRIRRRSHIEAEAVAIEHDCLIKIADDRAEEVAAADDERRGRLRARE